MSGSEHSLQVGRGIVESVAVAMVDMMLRRNRNPVRKNPDQRMQIKTAIAKIVSEIADLALRIPIEIDSHPIDNFWLAMLCSSHLHNIPYFNSSTGKNPTDSIQTRCEGVPKSVVPLLKATRQMSAHGDVILAACTL